LCSKQLKNERRGDLIWSIADANIKIGEGRDFDDVAEKNIEPILLGGALDSFGQFGSHTGVHLDCYALFGLLKDACCKIAGSWANLKNDIRLFEICLLNYSIGYTRILENMLTEMSLASIQRPDMISPVIPQVCVHAKNIVSRLCLCYRSGIWLVP
jgi:hypothetical protein